MVDLKDKIRSKGIKQTWIADKINRSPEELTMWLNGTRSMPDEIKKQILILIG
jgi:hypothetical protein